MINPLTALSFGGGRQTTAMLILAIKGEIPRPDVILFADTGCEWPETYSFLEQYVKPFCSANNFPFETVSRPGGSLFDYYAKVPALPVPNQRSCTDHFKIRPLRAWARTNNISTYQIGFSYDESGRASRPTKDKSIAREFPLIEARLTLHDCQYEIQKHGWPLPPKSSCYLCCFQSPSRLKQLALKSPELFDRLRELEIRAQARSGYYLIGNHPVTYYAAVEQLALDTMTGGCAEGYCFR